MGEVMIHALRGAPPSCPPLEDLWRDGGGKGGGRRRGDHVGCHGRLSAMHNRAPSIPHPPIPFDTLPGTEVILL
jgi:hypothetical protein